MNFGPDCPRCMSRRRIRQSRRRFWERTLFPIARARPFRCDGCGWRGWRLPPPVVPGAAIGTQDVRAAA